MLRSFNASTTVHPFTLPRASMHRIAAFTSESPSQTGSPAAQVSSTIQTPPVPSTGAGSQTPGSPSQTSNTISESAATQSRDGNFGSTIQASAATISDSSGIHGITENGLNLATSIPPFSPIGAPPASITSLTSTSSSTPTAAASSSGSSSLSQPGLISISVVGGVVAILAVSLLFYALRRRRQQLLNGLPLDSAPTSPSSRPNSFPPSRSEPNMGSTMTRSRIPSPLPTAYSPYHDEKEVFTPGPMTLIGNDNLINALASPRRPTHPLLSPGLNSPLTPLTPIANVPTASNLRRSLSWNLEQALPPPQPSPRSPVPLPPFNLQLSTVASYPEIRSQIQPVSPMYPLSPPSAGGQNVPMTPISPLNPPFPVVGRSELPSPIPSSMAFSFSDVRWGRRLSSTTRRTSRLGMEDVEEEVEVAASASILEKDLSIAPSDAIPVSAQRSTAPEPVELPASNSSTPSPVPEIASSLSSIGMAPLHPYPRTSVAARPQIKRSETAKSGASSRYSQANGGDRIIPKMPSRRLSEDGMVMGAEGQDRRSQAKSVVSSKRTGSWETETFSTLSIQSVLDLVRSASQKLGRGGGKRNGGGGGGGMV